MITKEQLQEIVTRAHMGGQMYAGCKHPSFGDAVGYYHNKVVKNLDIHIVSNNEERVTVCPTCENTFPHLYKDRGGHCEECNTEWAN